MRAALVLAYTLMFAAPALAEDYAARLDRLFAQLHTSQGTDDAKAAELKIWLIWSHNSTDDAVQALTHAGIAMQTGDAAEAEGTLGDLIEAHPDFAEAWNRRATLYYEMGRYQASLDDIEKVLALEPRHFGALSGKGMVLRAMGRNGEAVKAFKDALEANPNMDGVKASVEALEKLEPAL